MTLTLTDDELAAGLSNAAEVLLEESWHAIDGTRPGALERVTAALADISQFGAILRERVGAVR